MSLSDDDLAQLGAAKSLLENPGLAAKITSAVGSPIERGLALLPKRWATVVNEATRKSIETALDVALWSMDDALPHAPSNGWHKLAVGATGALGGAFGLAALSIELPLSTTLILRSIADIARSQGEDLYHPEAKLQCVQVLALGGASKKDDAADTGYFAARAAMAQAISAASNHLTRQGALRGAPVLTRVVAEVASRFSVNVSEKAAAQAIPMLGAIGGAAVNTLFIDHFQKMGRGHFMVRRLERLHGAEEVRRAYEAL